MIWLLDTDTIIFLIRGLKIINPQTPRQHSVQAMGQRIFDFARRHSSHGEEIALSAITVAELEFGAQNSRDYEGEMEILRRILTPFSLLSFDPEHCASYYGKIRHSLEATGRGIGSMDTLIAAHALAVNATLVTNNSGDFSRVDGLKLVNWALENGSSKC